VEAGPAGYHLLEGVDNGITGATRAIGGGRLQAPLCPPSILPLHRKYEMFGVSLPKASARHPTSNMQR